MEDLLLIIFIGIAAPLAMMLLICKGDTRRLLLFLLFGMTVCYATGWLNEIVRLALGVEP